MKRTLLLAAALVAIPLTAALAQAPPAASLTPAQIVAARQSAFALSRGSFLAMKAAADAGGDVKQLVAPARSLGRWARNLPAMFPAETNLPTSRALPALWSDRPGFEAKAVAYEAAALALAEAAQAGDRAAFLARWGEVGAACSACHDLYRSPN